MVNVDAAAAAAALGFVVLVVAVTASWKGVLVKVAAAVSLLLSLLFSLWTESSIEVLVRVGSLVGVHATNCNIGVGVITK